LSSHDFAFSYADDTVILAESSNQQAAQLHLSDRFNILNKWYHSNGLSLNISKSRCIIFSNYNIDNSLTVDLNSCSIPLSDNITLLGVAFDTHLNFNSHVSNIVKKAMQSIFLLKKIRKYINCEETKLIYTSVIRTRLEYCTTLLTFTSKANSDRIEACQNKAIRTICCAPKTFSVTDGRIVLGLHTLASRRNLFFRDLAMKIASGAGSLSALYELLHHSSRKTSSRTLRSACNFILPAINSNRGRNSFTYNTIKLLKGDSNLLANPSFHID